MIRLLLFITVSLSLFFACSDTSHQVKPMPFSLTVNDTIKIDQQAKYYELLDAGLNLNKKQKKKIRQILSEFRKKRKGASETAVRKLINIREKEVASILSPVQMELRKYINAKYHGSSPKDQFHPCNIQKDLKLTDGQTLKLVEVLKLYETNEDAKVRDQRLIAFLGKEKVDKYLKKIAKD